MILVRQIRVLLEQEVPGRHRSFSCVSELPETVLTVPIKCMHVLFN
jgi:hypothetical protein